MKGIDMLRTKVKNKLDSTINHIKAHPALYGYIAGAAVGITSTYLLTDYFIKDFLKDKKLVDLTDALKHIQESGLIGLKYEMGDETMILIPASLTDLNLD